MAGPVLAANVKIMKYSSHSLLKLYMVMSRDDALAWSWIGLEADTLMRVGSLKLDKASPQIYHRKCYQSLCHSLHLEKAQVKFVEEIKSAAESKK